jgi:hypothetical protein
MAKLGSITFQALDNSDVFLSEEVFLDGVDTLGEMQMPQPGFENDKAWITGNGPKVIPVNVDGDTSIIYGWFRGEEFSYPYIIRIYLECEEVEELKEKEDERGICT